MPDVVLEADAAREVAGLPKPIKAQLAELFARLADWPDVSGANPLRGKLAGRYRLRTGDYRLQFRVHGDQVIVERIGHRDGFYEGE